MGIPMYSEYTELNQNSSCAKADSLVENYYRNISKNIIKNSKLFSRTANPNGPREIVPRVQGDSEWMSE